MRAGDPPRTRLVLRLIAVERSLEQQVDAGREQDQTAHLSTAFGQLAERIMRSVELDPRQHFLHRIVARLHRLRAHQLRIVGVVAIGYGGLELVEGVGVWLDQLWAEYLTLIATSLLIPFEFYELAIRPSLWKAGGIFVNVLITKLPYRRKGQPFRCLYTLGSERTRSDGDRRPASHYYGRAARGAGSARAAGGVA